MTDGTTADHESSTVAQHHLLPPSTILLLTFQRSTAWEPVGPRAPGSHDELLLLAAALASHHRSILPARERLQNSALPERERLDAALLIDLKQQELATVIARIDEWVEQLAMPPQDDDVLDAAEPFPVSLGDLLSLMAEAAILLDPDFVFLTRQQVLARGQFRWEELSWAYNGYLADLIVGRRYPPTAVRPSEVAVRAEAPAGTPAAPGEGGAAEVKETEAQGLVHLRVAATDFQLDYVALRHDAESFAAELNDSTLAVTVTIDSEVREGLLPLPFWKGPPLGA